MLSRDDRAVTAEEATELARSSGIHCIPLSTPFAVGAVNTYLIEGDSLTLVDCGPNSATALVELEHGLAALGYRLADLELVIVSHQHIDHTGLAQAVAQRAGVEIACLELLAPVLRDWEKHAAQDADDGRALMLRHGVDARVADAVHAMVTIVHRWGASAEVNRTFRDGDRLVVNAHEFDVLHRPGHSPSDTVLYNPRLHIALCGDHLLAEVSSNAQISRPLQDWDGRRPQTLIDYRNSLHATRLLDIDVALCGHGRPVTDHRALIDKRLRAQDNRAQSLLELLRGRPQSAHELATTLWGRGAITQAFLTLSEVLGHLDLLMRDGSVVEDHGGPVARFECV
jgi:glyoxylase-like metal-dependent hydrolase (beta-lactamase superfamily II)